ncbi:hypothetical protein PVAP13_8KG323702 [Panicum virgatum]|uniref:Uncharacterized protein n=1 Tax=Panicum virgatum TaxID=38727 RepID=A0A8T0PMK7_PANVG|nr:hypothetical protein PVAP13_8KG323702 [Panicum virgatum]
MSAQVITSAARRAHSRRRRRHPRWRSPDDAEDGGVFDAAAAANVDARTEVLGHRQPVRRSARRWRCGRPGAAQESEAEGPGAAAANGGVCARGGASGMEDRGRRPAAEEERARHRRGGGSGATGRRLGDGGEARWWGGGGVATGGSSSGESISAEAKVRGIGAPIIYIWVPL